MRLIETSYSCSPEDQQHKTLSHEHLSCFIVILFKGDLLWPHLFIWAILPLDYEVHRRIQFYKIITKDKSSYVLEWYIYIRKKLKQTLDTKNLNCYMLNYNRPVSEDFKNSMYSRVNKVKRKCHVNYVERNVWAAEKHKMKEEFDPSSQSESAVSRVDTSHHFGVLDRSGHSGFSTC